MGVIGGDWGWNRGKTDGASSSFHTHLPVLQPLPLPWPLPLPLSLGQGQGQLMQPLFSHLRDQGARFWYQLHG